MGITRTVLSTLFALTAASAIALAQTPTPGPAAPASAKADKPLRILVLGGTAFLGPAVVDSAKARGHHVTIFNRGKTEKRIKPLAIDGVEHLFGNRDPNLRSDDKDDNSPKGLAQLQTGEWDAVVDTSGYVPRIVKASAELLAPRIKQYIFISTVSVYAHSDASNQTESAELEKMEDPASEEVMGNQGKNYGALKALCEQAAEAAVPGRVCNIRPGFIVGPGDSSDRFTYWTIRASRGGEMLAPGAPTDHIQVIDVRDLADFIVLSAEKNTVGTFNAVGNPLPWGSVLNTVLEGTKEKAPTPTTLTWVPTDFLDAHKFGPGPALPIWVPSSGEDAGFHTRSNARGVAAGMKFRPLRETVDALVVWWPKEVARRDRVGKEMKEDAAKAGKPEPRIPDANIPRAGLKPEHEVELLKAWHDKEKADAAPKAPASEAPAAPKAP